MAVAHVLVRAEVGGVGAGSTSLRIRRWMLNELGSSWSVAL
jgi:hypothetical protein